MFSGDIGYVDGANTLYVVDRLKELIKYKGLQVDKLVEHIFRRKSFEENIPYPRSINWIIRLSDTVKRLHKTEPLNYGASK